MELLKQTADHQLSSEQLEHINQFQEPAKRLAAAHGMLGRDVFVVMPCASLARPGVALEGARLTLQAGGHSGESGGHSLTLRIAGTPERNQLVIGCNVCCC